MRSMNRLRPASWCTVFAVITAAGILYAQEAQISPAMRSDGSVRVESIPSSGADEAGQADYVSIHVDGGEIGQVLNAFAMQTGRNLVIGPEVTGDQVNIHLSNVKWEDALDVILKPYGFGYRKVGDIIVVSQLDKLSSLATVEPLATRVFELNYLDAADVKEMLEKQLSPRGTLSIMTVRGQRGWEFAAQGRRYSRGATSLSKRTRAEEDESQARSKTLVATDIPGVLDRIADVLSEVDRMPQQVLVEARFLEVNNNFLQDIGVDISSSWKLSDNSTIGFNSAFNEVEPNAFLPASEGLEGDPLNSGFGGYPDQNGDFSFRKLSSPSLDILLELIQEDDDSNLLSAPHILTLNNQEATIIIGQKYPIIESDVTGDNATVSSTLDYYENIGIQLNVVPQITKDNYVNMIVHPSVSAIDDFASAKAGSIGAVALTEYPIINVREAETQILLKNEESVVMGGLLDEREAKTVSKVPLLGDVPYLGRLFRRDTTSTKKIDLLIFLKATIVTPENYEMVIEKVEEVPAQAENVEVIIVNTPEATVSEAVEVPQSEEVIAGELVIEVPEEEVPDVETEVSAPEVSVSEDSEPEMSESDSVPEEEEVVPVVENAPPPVPSEEAEEISPEPEEEAME